MAPESKTCLFSFVSSFEYLFYGMTVAVVKGRPTLCSNIHQGEILNDQRGSISLAKHTADTV